MELVWLGSSGLQMWLQYLEFPKCGRWVRCCADGPVVWPSLATVGNLLLPLAPKTAGRLWTCAHCVLYADAVCSLKYREEASLSIELGRDFFFLRTRKQADGARRSSNTCGTVYSDGRSCRSFLLPLSLSLPSLPIPLTRPQRRRKKSIFSQAALIDTVEPWEPSAWFSLLSEMRAKHNSL